MLVDRKSYFVNPFTRKKRATWNCVLFLLAFCFVSNLSLAQVYPVQATVQLTPPYSLYLADYVDSGSERLALNIFLSDIARPDLDVRFRLKIIGQGITLETKPGYIPPPVSIQGGVPLRLISTDLAEYFNPNNLTFQGLSQREYAQRGKLPEGVYQFCFEVLEYNRGLKISNTACAVAWLVLNDPPIVNLPRQEEKLKAQSLQNVMFQWTPRHTGSPNSAFTTEYEIKMVEVWPATRNPNDAVLTSPPILEETTRNTTFIYGPGETPLEPGRRYAFRVQAKSISGVDELDLFKNHGYSEVVSFVYGDACDLPTGISIESVGPSRFALRWESMFNHTAFKVRYRQEGTVDWYEDNVSLESTQILSLKPSTTYEYQVAATCGFFDGDYSPIARVTTAEEVPVDYSCGIPLTPFNLDPSELTGSLKPGDIIQAGDFQVELISVNGSNGIFSGEGIIEVPYLNKARVKTSFTNITVSKELRMVNGFMNVTGAAVDVVPQEILDGMEQLSEVLEVVDTALNIIEENIPEQIDWNSFVADTLVAVSGEIVGVNKNEDGSVTVTDSNGQTQTLPARNNYAVKDDSGNGYLVDKKGNIHATSSSVATKMANREYNLVVTFSKDPKSHYGFDHSGLNPPDDTEALGEGDPEDRYKVAWKSVATGRVDDVTARLEGSAIDKSKIRFELGGIDVQAPPMGADQTTTVGVTGKSDGSFEALLALYAPSDTAKEQVLGKLRVASYDEIPRKLFIVPVNDSFLPASLSATSIRDSLNAIYHQAVVHWEVEVKPAITVTLNDQFDDGGSGLLSNYTGDMKKVINAYGTLEEDTYYLFLVSNPSSGLGLGYMPRGKEAGFIFVDKHGSAQALVRTMAHEVGHGAFNLAHTFDEPNFPLTKGSTDNVMDYPAGNKLYKYQWDKMRYPDIVVGLFEADSAGANYIVSVDRKFRNLDNKTISFLSPTGQIVSLPSEFMPRVEFAYGVLSALDQDPVNGLNYHFNIASGHLFKFGLKEGDDTRVYKFDDATNTYRDEETGNVFVDTTNLEFVDGFVFPIPCGSDYNLYKFEKAELTNFVNGSGKRLTFSEMAAVFQPFNLQMPLKSSGEVIKQSVKALVDNSCQWCMQEAIVKMTEDHCETPELLYIDKIAQLRSVFPEYFDAFTQAENWEMPVDKTYMTGSVAVSTPVNNYATIPYDHWAWGKILKENPDLKIKYDQRIDLRNYFMTFCYAFRDYIQSGMTASDTFWQDLNEDTPSLRIISHLGKEPAYVTQQVAFEKRQLAIRNLVQNALPEMEENAIIRLLSTVKPKESASLLEFVAVDIGFKDVFEKFDDFGGEDNFTRVLTLLSSYIESPVKNVEAFEKALYPTPEIVSIDLDLINNRQTAGLHIDESNNIHFYHEVRKQRSPTDDPRIPAAIENEDFLVVPYHETIPIQFYTEFEISGIIYRSKEVAEMPAIYAALLLTKGNGDLFEKKAWLVADGVMLLVGAGEIKVLFSAASWMRKLAIAGELAGGVGGLITESVPETVISADMKRRLRVLNLALGSPLLLQTLRNGVTKLVTDLKAAKNADGATTQIRQEIDAVVSRVEKEVGETMLATQGGSVLNFLPNGEIFYNASKIADVNNGALTFYPGVSAQGAKGDEVLNLATVTTIVEDGVEYEAKNVRIFVRENEWVFEAEGSFCFVAGTPIYVGGQTVPIETIKRNSTVLSYDHSTGKQIRARVLKTFRKTVDKLVKVVIAGSLILATPEHPFYSNEAYVPAQELSEGDSVISVSGEKLVITSVTVVDTTATVYNLEVEGQHNYFVSEAGILVHNSCALKTIYGLLPDQESRNAFKAALRKLPTSIDRADVVTEITKGANPQSIEALARCLSNDGNMAAWQLLKQHGRTGFPNGDPYNALIRKVDAIEALASARKNTKLKQVLNQSALGNADDILASIKGHENTSYSELINDLNLFGSFLDENTAIRLVQFDGLVSTLINNSGNNSQGVHGVLKEILDNPSFYKDKTLTFEYRVANSRQTSSPSRIDIYTGDQIHHMIEVKWITSNIKVPEAQFIQEFIERDLFFATDLGQILWKIRGTKLTPEDVRNYLIAGRKNINALASSPDPLIANKIRTWFKMTGITVTDVQIMSFVDTYYKNIFQ